MDILFGSKTPSHSDPPERPKSFRRLDDQLPKVKQLVQGISRQFASFQELVCTSFARDEDRDSSSLMGTTV